MPATELAPPRLPLNRKSSYKLVVRYLPNIAKLSSRVLFVTRPRPVGVALIRRLYLDGNASLGSIHSTPIGQKYLRGCAALDPDI